ncbi:hypothetical protein PCANC_02565 [Puccinia coronata f. sp. avenae]|uniref:Plasmodium RESA N-terminal domain-containing protein n=1 Tax=Puccinia coronata f. sp. avenae TaxID=200324 RepID=A0A2N5VYI6_9BASI|nr:hypothetical protein PCANC_02565 [Puccinia coronata f. sp. avenae]
MSGPRVSLAVKGDYQRIILKQITICLLPILFYCVCSTPTANFVLPPVIFLPPVAEGSGEESISRQFHMLRDSAGRGGEHIAQDSAGRGGENIAQEVGLLPSREGAVDGPSAEKTDRSSEMYSKSTLEESPAPTDEDLIATDNSISEFNKAFHNFKGHHMDTLAIINEDIQEQEKLNLFLIDWADRLVLKAHMSGGDVQTVYEKVDEALHSSALHGEFTKTLQLSARDFKIESWWTRFRNYLLYFFNKEEWRQGNASRQLSKLRRAYIESPEPTLLNDKMKKAVKKLSIFARKGLDFPERELQLIENMSHTASHHITTEDGELISEIATETLAQRRKRMIHKWRQMKIGTREK